MTPLTTVEVVVLCACVVVSALASGTETALTSVGRLRVRHLAEEGSKQAAKLQRLQADPNRFLSTVLVINTVALIVASSMTTLLGVQYLPHSWGFWGDLGAALLLSVFLLIFAEVTPKSLAIRQAERIALLTASPVEWLSRVLAPVLWFITRVAVAITGGRAARAPYLSEQELLTILAVSEEQGVIEEEEREMIHGIIEIGDTSVREVMVPRLDITAVPVTSSLNDIAALYSKYKHTRMPVYEGDIDHIKGLIHIKDLLLYYVGGRSDFSMTKSMRKIEFVPESRKVDEALHDMQTKKVHMMIVVDEYGGTSGLITLEDLLEEIVGEIRDEYDTAEEEPLRLLNETEALVDARFPMEELNNRLSLGIEESNDYDSVGGYVYATIGIPERGATFDANGVKWTVEDIDGQRIGRVRLKAAQPWPDEALVGAGMKPVRREGQPGETLIDNPLGHG
ncbi:MAG TPA: hemolysin family protein [Candidatus Dormibacteraeota bacterium]